MSDDSFKLALNFVNDAIVGYLYIMVEVIYFSLRLNFGLFLH